MTSRPQWGFLNVPAAKKGRCHETHCAMCADALAAASVKQALDGADAVLSGNGPTERRNPTKPACTSAQAAVQAMTATNVRRIIVVSAAPQPGHRPASNAATSRPTGSITPVIREAGPEPPGMRPRRELRRETRSCPVAREIMRWRATPTCTGVQAAAVRST
jgi:hypothetical protein